MCEMCEQIRERLHGEAEPEVVEVSEDAVETATEAAVEIAQIEAERDVTIEQEVTKREEMWQEGRVAELEGELRGMRELLDRLAPPEPEPEPVVVVADPPAEPEPVAEPVMDLPTSEPKSSPKKKSGSWF